MNKKILRKRKGKWITLSATVLAAVSGATLSSNIQTAHAQDEVPVIEESESILYDETAIDQEISTDNVDYSQPLIEETTEIVYEEVVDSQLENEANDDGQVDYSQEIIEETAVESSEDIEMVVEENSVGTSDVESQEVLPELEIIDDSVATSEETTLTDDQIEIIESTPEVETAQEDIVIADDTITSEIIEEPAEEAPELETSQPELIEQEDVVIAEDTSVSEIPEIIEESVEEVSEELPIETETDAELIEETLPIEFEDESITTEDIVNDSQDNDTEAAEETTEETIEETIEYTTEDVVESTIEEQTENTQESSEVASDQIVEDQLEDGETSEEEDVESSVTVETSQEAEPTEEKVVTNTPAEEKETTSNNATERYQVQRGDTLYSIAQRTGVSVKDLQEMNNLTSTLIHPNTDLIVAQNTSATTTREEQRRRETAKNVTVNAGDTLYSIARRNNVSVNDLRKWNNLSNDTIYLKQNLSLSQTNETNSQQPSANTAKQANYTVRQGDTLYSIAHRNGMTVAQLKELNGMTGNTILVNQSLRLANSTNEASNSSAENSSNETNNNYRIQRGDTLYSIAKRNNVTVSQLSEWNNLTDNMIHINQEIIINQANQDDDTTDSNETDNSTEVEVVTDSEAKTKLIQWFKDREGKTTYSMTYRNGPTSYDCSSAVFSALIYAGYLPEGTWLGNTETLFGLEGSLLIPITAEEVTAGDIFVNGIKGDSLGAGGHTGVAVSNSSIIHSNYSDNGISTTAISGRTGSGPTYWYRLNEAMLQI